MKKVVYLSYMPCSEKVERDWYIGHLRDHGVCVEFWDLAPLLFPGLPGGSAPGREYVVKVAAYDRLRELITRQEIAQTNFVLLFNYEGRFCRLFTLLTRYDCRLYFFEWGNFPIKERRSASGYLKRLLQPGKFARAASHRVKSVLVRKLKLVKPFDVVFAAGAASLVKHPAAGKLIPINLCDYDNCLQASGSKPLIGRRYAVFLDINLAFQTDLKLLGWDCIDAGRYGASLCGFFTMVEQRFGVEVVIAGHPRANYGADYFAGRVVMKGVTPELVKDAEFVISHHSTSISYAVLNLKQLLFIYTEDMKQAYSDTVVSYIHDFAEYLGQPVLNVDQLKRGDELNLSPCDAERYDSYKYHYLTSRESETGLNRDIVLAELTK